MYLRLPDGADARPGRGHGRTRGGRACRSCTLDTRGAYDLGGQFLLWEIATAVAGAVLGIDPFDEPNVQESKDNTRRVLAEYEKARRRLPAEAPARRRRVAFAVGDDGLRPALRDLLAPGASAGTTSPCRPTSRPGEAVRAELQRHARACCATPARWPPRSAIGPRFLHSTGQYHKGGPATASSCSSSRAARWTCRCPGRPYTFGVLKRAQALGDLQALRRARPPRAARLHGRRRARRAERLRQVLEAVL